MAGIWRDGNSFTGNSGTSNSPSKAIAMNDTMTENDDFKVWVYVCDAVAVCVLAQTGVEVYLKLVGQRYIVLKVEECKPT